MAGLTATTGRGIGLRIVSRGAGGRQTQRKRDLGQKGGMEFCRWMIAEMQLN